MADMRTLGMGSRGDDVRALQEFLLSQGYDLGPMGADGEFGRRTQEAVRQFQTAAGIQADSVVGPQTRQAIAQVLTQPLPRPRPDQGISRETQQATAAPVGPVDRMPLPPALGPAQGPIRQGGTQGPVMPSGLPAGPPALGATQGPIRQGAMQGPPSMQPQPLGPAPRQPTQVQMRPVVPGAAGAAQPNPGATQVQMRPVTLPQQQANTFPVAGGAAYGPGAPVPRQNQSPGSLQPQGNYPMIADMAGAYSRPPDMMNEAMRQYAIAQAAGPGWNAMQQGMPGGMPPMAWGFDGTQAMVPNAFQIPVTPTVGPVMPGMGPMRGSPGRLAPTLGNLLGITPETAPYVGGLVPGMV